MTIEPDPLPRHSPSVVLRRLSHTDLEAFQAYRTDADLGRYQGWSAMPDREARAFLDEMNKALLFRPGKWVQIGIAEPKTLSLIGDIGLYVAEDAREAEIGFTLARHMHGAGRATEAVRQALQIVFECTAVEHVLGITDARNHASMALLERVGMRRTRERKVVFRGEACTEYVYLLARGGG